MMKPHLVSSTILQIVLPIFGTHAFQAIDESRMQDIITTRVYTLPSDAPTFLALGMFALLSVSTIAFLNSHKPCEETPINTLPVSTGVFEDLTAISHFMAKHPRKKSDEPRSQRAITHRMTRDTPATEARNSDKGVVMTFGTDRPEVYLSMLRNRCVETRSCACPCKHHSPPFSPSRTRVSLAASATTREMRLPLSLCTSRASVRALSAGSLAVTVDAGRGGVGLVREAASFIGVRVDAGGWGGRMGCAQIQTQAQDLSRGAVAIGVVGEEEAHEEVEVEGGGTAMLGEEIMLTKDLIVGNERDVMMMRLQTQVGQEFVGQSSVLSFVFAFLTFVTSLFHNTFIAGRPMVVRTFDHY